MSGGSGPLAGLRVVELASEIAGPYAAKLLRDLGARVVKIEDSTAPDSLRRWSASGAELRPDEDAPLFRFLSAGKRSVALDLATASGRAAVLELFAAADVVIESLPPGEIDDLGLGSEAIWSRARGVSLVSISSFGRSGPWRDRPATEFTLQAQCGSTASRGRPGTPPISAGGRLGEWVCGAFAALAALAAGESARRSGRGEHVDLSLLEVMFLTMAPNLALYQSLAGRKHAYPRSLELPSIEPTADGYVGFCTITGQQWRDFMLLIERPDLADDPGLAAWDSRNQRAAEITAIIHQWTRRHPVAEIIERASALRIPVAPIGNGAMTAGFDHFVARRVYVPHPGGAFLQPRPPTRFSDSALPPIEPAPRLGEHGDEILDPYGEWLAPRSRSAPQPMGGVAGELAEKPLAGLRVIDFTAFWAGPFVTHTLAALGAEVIKVESIQRPDGMRFASTRPPTHDRWWEWSALFQGFNLGKRGITLDLGQARGLELVKQLIDGADAVVENFSPRVMDNLGLRYVDLAARNPRLIFVRMPAFGLDGPWRDRVGFAQTMEQISGMAWLTGFADGPPIIPRGLCDPLAGLHAGIALLAALEQRRATGRGQLVEATMVEAALNAAAEQVLEFQVHGALLTRDGNRGPVGAPQNLYACRGDDRWIALAVTSEAQWQALRAWLGDPSWAGDPRLTTAAGRRAAHDDIDRHLAVHFAAQEVEAAVDALIGRGVPAAAVEAADVMATNPQARARGFFSRVDHAVVGDHEYPGLPFRLSSTPPRWYGAPSPTLGQHNDEVLRDLLGLSSEEIEELRRAGVIGERPANL
jgi:crotonobetainyl-CoA:carnitine CoA-transferase CaiB-like acyl-CoA transferase